MKNDGSLRQCSFGKANWGEEQTYFLSSRSFSDQAPMSPSSIKLPMDRLIQLDLLLQTLHRTPEYHNIEFRGQFFKRLSGALRRDWIYNCFDYELGHTLRCHFSIKKTGLRSCEAKLIQALEMCGLWKRCKNDKLLVKKNLIKNGD